MPTSRRPRRGPALHLRALGATASANSCARASTAQPRQAPVSVMIGSSRRLGIPLSPRHPVMLKLFTTTRTDRRNRPSRSQERCRAVCARDRRAARRPASSIRRPAECSPQAASGTACSQLPTRGCDAGEGACASASCPACSETINESAKRRVDADLVDQPRVWP